MREKWRRCTYGREDVAILFYGPGQGPTLSQKNSCITVTPLAASKLTSCTLPGWLQKTLLSLFLMQPLWLHWKLEDAIFVLLACNQPGCTRNPRMQLFCNPPGCIWHWRMQLWPPFFGLMALPVLYLSTWVRPLYHCNDNIYKVLSWVSKFDPESSAYANRSSFGRPLHYEARFQNFHAF